MKTKEELLKIYSAYLPYELEILTPIWSVDKKENTIQQLHSVTKNDLRVKVDKNGFFNCWFETCKPILYSMDMLAKEIEHNGKRFIPLIMLSKLVDSGHSVDSKIKQFSGLDFLIYTDKCDDVENVRIRFSKVFSIERSSQNVLASTVLKIQTLLIEWHFNIFGLEESDYIKKENLK